MHQEKIKGSILENTSRFVTQFFNEKLPVWAVYHNLQHTIETVNGCLEIGRGVDLEEGNLEIICLAAWFHDIGYLFTVEGHEEKSSEIAMSFLKENAYPLNRINTIKDCIMATKISTHPKNFMEFVICDSDLISLGSKEYFNKNDLLKLELEMKENKTISDLNWLKRSLDFLSSHTYFTEYAKLKFNHQLEKNIIALQKKIESYNL